MQDLLGDARDFKDEFERYIAAGTDKHATLRAREMGSARAAQLRARLAPFFLRRDKKDVLKTSGYVHPALDSRLLALLSAVLLELGAMPKPPVGSALQCAGAWGLRILNTVS